MSSQIRHSDEYNALDTSLTALEEYMVKLSQRLDALTRRVDKLEDGGE